MRRLHPPADRGQIGAGCHLAIAGRDKLVALLELARSARFMQPGQISAHPTGPILSPEADRAGPAESGCAAAT